jgi:hypothetical protein
MKIKKSATATVYATNGAAFRLLVGNEHDVNRVEFPVCIARHKHLLGLVEAQDGEAIGFELKGEADDVFFELGHSASFEMTTRRKR